MIQIENLYFSYTGTAPYLLDNLNFFVPEGDYVSIVGNNGSGKSTLVKLVLKLLKPDRGIIKNDFQRTGYVPQNKDFGYFPLTVHEMLNSYRKLLAIKNISVIEECLEIVGMNSYSSALIGNLSGGQSQKILIARALLGNPDLLILDEPSTGLDMQSQREIYDFIMQINRKHHITIISVEHNMEAAIANSSRIYHMQHGQGHECSPQKYAAEYLNIK